MFQHILLINLIPYAKNVDIYIEFTQLVSGKTVNIDAQSQSIGNPNNLKVIVIVNTKEAKQNRQPIYQLLLYFMYVSCNFIG